MDTRRTCAAPPIPIGKFGTSPPVRKTPANGMTRHFTTTVDARKALGGLHEGNVPLSAGMRTPCHRPPLAQWMHVAPYLSDHIEESPHLNGSRAPLFLRTESGWIVRKDGMIVPQGRTNYCFDRPVRPEPSTSTE